MKVKEDDKDVENKIKKEEVNEAIRRQTRLRLRGRMDLENEALK